jgi:hypothetical protein
MRPSRRRLNGYHGYIVMALSYVTDHPDRPWNVYLMQVDRVLPYLGKLARWAASRPPGAVSSSLAARRRGAWA